MKSKKSSNKHKNNTFHSMCCSHSFSFTCFCFLLAKNIFTTSTLDDDDDDDDVDDDGEHKNVIVGKFSRDSYYF